MRLTSKRTLSSDVGCVCFAVFATGLLGACRSPSSHAPANRPAKTLTLGMGQVLSDPQYGIRQAAALIALEGLADVGRDGRPRPLLAKSWNVTDDGRVLRIHLRPSVTFHDGTAVTAETIRLSVERSLQNYLGEAYKNIDAIRSVSTLELEINLKNRSNFVVEALDSPISSAANPNVGTGPFSISTISAARIEMPANRAYYLGAPLIDKIELIPYESFRAAWADMLRGRLDMLYEVGLEGLESLRPSSNVRIFTHRREYAYILAFNMRRREFESAKLRRALNEAIDRDEVVRDALAGHGVAAPGPMWPDHWASRPTDAKFSYDPMAAAKSIDPGSPRLTFSCSFPAAQPYERLALVIQRQLRRVGIDITLDPRPNDQFISRITTGQFETMLADASLGPTVLQQYQWWDSKGPRNFTGVTNPRLDAALNAVDRAPDDASYAAGVESFLNAIVDDPPAIFLAWGERARAVSTRFQVPAQTGRDILNAIRLFRPVVGDDATSRN